MVSNAEFKVYDRVKFTINVQYTQLLQYTLNKVFKSFLLNSEILKLYLCKIVIFLSFVFSYASQSE